MGSPHPPDKDKDERLELIEFSYKEVLDATKHQDDKIGRMLTTVAFLTAASLALAALSSTQFVVRDFVVPPFHLPLGLIALVVFLSGVLFTVVLLLTSLSTPLRVPGLAETSAVTRRRKGPWVGDVPASQMYFYSISGVTLDEWERKWDEPVAELREERLELLVRETHNIGVRTTFKYDRGTEAGALFSFSLLSFGLAVIFVAVAAGTGGAAAVTMGPVQRGLVGVVLGGYCGMQLLARLRYAQQSLDDSSPVDERWQVRLRLWSGRAFALLLTFFVFAIVLYDNGWPPRDVSAWVVVITSALTCAAFWGASIVVSPPGDARRVRTRTRRNRAVVTLLSVLILAFALWFILAGWYAWQLLLAVSVVVLLVGSAALAPTLAIAERREEYRDRYEKRRASGVPADPSIAEVVRMARLWLVGRRRRLRARRRLGR